MKNLTFIAFCFLALLSSAQNDITSIDLDKILDTKAKMKTTDFFELVEFIPLETKPECLTTNSYTVLTSDAIYMFSKGQNCILKFDRQGNFITKIGKKGRGPGEFCAPVCMIQYYGGFIYLTDPTCKKILKYNTDGELQEEIPLKGNPGFMFSDVLNEDCFIIVKMAPLLGQKAPYTEVMTFNSKGKKVKEFPLFTESTNKGISMEPFILWHFDDKLCYKSSYSDNAYVIVDAKTVKPIYNITIKKEKTKTTIDPLAASMPFGTIYSIYETNKYLIINGGFRLVYNKNNGDYYKVALFDKEKRITSLSFLWPSAIFRNESKVPGEYMSVIDPYELTGIDFKTLDIESEHLRSELIKLQAKVNENDNPIIVVMKEK